MRYYGYCRVSTATQAEKGYGLEEQQNEINDLARGKGICIEDFFVDAGVSGNMKETDDDEALNKRSALIELLGTIEKGDCVVVANTSRLWRSDLTKALVRRELLRRGACVLSVQQPDYDLCAASTDPSSYLQNAIMEALDVYERMSISLKLARGRTVKAKGGDKPAGVCPIGYRYSDDKKSVIVDEVEAAIVKLIFTEGQKGQSLHRIAETLNRKGLKTRRGKDWSAAGVHAIIRNRFYLGELQHQGSTIKGNHTPLVSKIQFGKCQASLERRRKV